MAKIHLERQYGSQELNSLNLPTHPPPPNLLKEVSRGLK